VPWFTVRLVKSFKGLSLDLAQSLILKRHPSKGEKEATQAWLCYPKNVASLKLGGGGKLWGRGGGKAKENR